MLASAVEHHAVLDPVEWLAKHEGAEVEWLPVDDLGRVDVAAATAAIERDPGSVALVTVLWANNEVGTIQPVEELAAVAHRYGIPVHSDAVQALGQLPLDLGTTAVDCLTLSGHKVGGPIGAGALVARRGLDLVPVLHGGGQERGLRSGTLDAPAVRAFAVAADLAARRRPETAARLAALRDDLVDAVRAAVRMRSCAATRIRRAGSRATPTSPSPAARATPCSTCSTPAAWSARRARPARPACRSRATSCWPWASADDARGALRFSLGPAVDRGDVDALAAAIGPAVERARAPGSRVRGRPVRVLAAMSGGVDSAVAAARAVDAGHDVVGVHLALARNPATLRTGARGCCTVEDAHDARRAADVLGIPFYVWDLAERFERGRRRGLRRRVRRGPDAEPVRPVQRADQVLRAARQGHRARLRRGLHRSLRAHASRAASCTARPTPRRTSRTCWPC